MAYIKYKELTKNFNFNKEINSETLPIYVTDYIYEDETIYKAYRTIRDKAVFLDNRMILFDISPIFNSKKIHIIPYRSISSGTIIFKANIATMFLSFDSGYQMKLNFVRLSNDGKTEIRKLYYYIMRNIR